MITYNRGFWNISKMYELVNAFCSFLYSWNWMPKYLMWLYHDHDFLIQFLLKDILKSKMPCFLNSCLCLYPHLSFKIGTTGPFETTVLRDSVSPCTKNKMKGNLENMQWHGYTSIMGSVLCANMCRYTSFCFGETSEIVLNLVLHMHGKYYWWKP
jgi:hypothetical protein